MPIIFKLKNTSGTIAESLILENKPNIVFVICLLKKYGEFEKRSPPTVSDHLLGKYQIIARHIHHHTRISIPFQLLTIMPV
ncbi:MAG: hypothetical protein MK289_14975 [Trichodesmium sp. ALOHA_ZT_67]|uniref:hypothetical protein n=1 Tax=Trichodesmium erythraeum TaxID=1206 RepID=UPI0005C4717E|nr:hypothetical protein [Trichodesmium sp. ALOHA_ZT_67]MDE5096553.1 hypothetical protein [Trichodesmium sp. St11_bin5]MDT9342487.1 hypothetical protein [Trichodesmium erythraeum 21-75]